MSAAQTIPGSGPPYQLNLGAGHTYIPGMINIDISERAEVSLDLGKDPLPFPDNSVERVFSMWTLEHVGDYLFALQEIHRVLRHDGELLLKLPYVSLTEMHLVNPYHLHNFNERSFDLFDPKILKNSAAEETDVAFRKVSVRYAYMGWFGALPGPVRAWSRRHLLNVVRAFDIGLVAIKDPQAPVDTSAERGREMLARIQELTLSRRDYPDIPAPRMEPGSRRRAGNVSRLLVRARRRTEMKTR